MTRQSVWSDKTVQELLVSFVSVADEVGRLQRGDDAECRAFKSFCEEGHYGGRSEPTSTRQGIYAVTPKGKFLASINTRSAANMAAMLRTALARWAELPEAERRLTDEEVHALQATKRFEDRYPTDGLVLVEYLRDLGRPVVERDWRTRAWNTDHVWFTRSEAAALVPDSPEIGARTTVPARLVERLARLHLVDSVRGQTPSLSKDAIVEAWLQSEVVGRDGDDILLQFAGKTRTETKGRWPIDTEAAASTQLRGVSTELRGRARWHAKDQRFTTFELLAIGERWGETQYNERSGDAAPAAIGFAFVLAKPDHPRVAPAFWWEYELK